MKELETNETNISNDKIQATNDSSKKAKDHYIRKLSQRLPKGLLLSRLKEVKTGSPEHSRQCSKGAVDSGSLTTAVRAAKITNAYS